MSPRPRPGRLAVALLATALLAAAGAPVRGAAPESAPVSTLDGVQVIGADDLARLLGATKFWRADVRKLTLRVRQHQVQLTVGDPFALVDDGTVLLPAPVRTRGGELQVPVALVARLPVERGLARLWLDAPRSRVVLLPPGGTVGSPRISAGSAVTRVTFPADEPSEASVVALSRAHFRLRFDGYFSGALPDTLDPGALVRSIRLARPSTGTAFELVVDPAAVGYRLLTDERAHQVTLELSALGREGLEPFAPEGPPGPRPLHVVVLDPGHGGSDPGVRVGGAVEKDLTLELARRLRIELERRLPVRVVLTREDDRDVSVEQRAEIANQARADLVISLHFDGFAGPAAHGATALFPEATFAEESGGPTSAVPMLPWRDVAIRHAVESRALAEDLLSELELHGQGPTRFRTLLPYPLLGVNAPGVLLECATLTSRADRDRVTSPDGMAALASTLADGVIDYQLHR